MSYDALTDITGEKGFLVGSTESLFSSRLKDS